MLIEHFISNGMEYELVPNLLADDETINLRIPLYGDNATRKDVQFLAAKYNNTFAILNIPFTEICGGLNWPFFTYRSIERQYHVQFYLPPAKQIIVYSIINTIRFLFPSEDDVTIFHKTIESLQEVMQSRPQMSFLTNCYYSLLK